VTLAYNLPLDRSMLQFQPDMPFSAWHALRARWVRWHAVRNLLNLAALVLRTL
jgi:uncharacterized membrane protein